MHPFSAALCRSLIEAAIGAGKMPCGRICFLRLYAAASLKLEVDRAVAELIDVFCGFMPQPH